MFQKSSKKIWPEPKLERHTMLHLKFGRINHMVSRVICGRWAVFFMKWPHLSRPLLPLICQACTKKYVLDIFLPFQQATQAICQKLLLCFSNKIQVKGPIQSSFFKILLYTKCTLESLMWSQKSKMMMTFCWKRLKSTMATFHQLKTFFPKQIMMVNLNQAVVGQTPSKESKQKLPEKSKSQHKSQLKPQRSKDPNRQPQSKKRKKNNKKWLIIIWKWKEDMRKNKDKDWLMISKMIRKT